MACIYILLIFSACTVFESVECMAVILARAIGHICPACLSSCNGRQSADQQFTSESQELNYYSIRSDLVFMFKPASDISGLSSMMSELFEAGREA